MTEAWQDPNMGPLVWLAMATGARRGELCALRRRHIDTTRGVVVIDSAIVQASGRVWEKDTQLHLRRHIACWWPGSTCHCGRTARACPQRPLDPALPRRLDTEADQRASRVLMDRLPFPPHFAARHHVAASTVHRAMAPQLWITVSVWRCMMTLFTASWSTAPTRG